ncbi:hypothetical protein [Microvirga sp. VF16]|uniref:hypothetical protein n=1 Tax=Microvirga sp. VF16 TaxID=2807101 RepID=UPI00193D0C86|nr:hypothetical protein [Microvirga sp. VF16]QRM34923.1 hypothetical protein JO965_42445 [Microvirga sp. VF16]
MTDKSIVLTAAKRLDPAAWTPETLKLTDPRLSREFAERRAKSVRTVRVVLETLKDPTEGMLEAGFYAIPTPRPYNTDRLRMSFIGMLDFALKLPEAK